MDKAGQCQESDCREVFPVHTLAGSRAGGARFAEPDEYEPTECPECGGEWDWAPEGASNYDSRDRADGYDRPEEVAGER